MRRLKDGETKNANAMRFSFFPFYDYPNFVFVSICGHKVRGAKAKKLYR
jgi:hypothetical protein